MSTLSSEQQEDAAYVESLMTEGKPFHLDLSDDRQYRHAVTMHNLAGQTPETRPGLHAALAATREIHAANGPADPPPPQGPWENGGVVSNVGLNQAKTGAAADGFTGFVGGAAQVNAAMVVKPKGNGAVLASGSKSDFGDGTYVPVFAAPVSGQTAASAMTATLFYSYQLQAGGPWASSQVVKQVQLGTQADPTVVQPQKQSWTPPQNNYIQIGIGRGIGDKNNDCDFLCFSNGLTNYYVPFVGQVDFVTAPPATNQLVLNQNIFIYGNLARWTVGGAGGHMALPDSEKQRIFATIQTSGMTMKWNMPAPTWQAPQPPPTALGNPINWGQLAWTSGELDYLSIQFVVLLSDGTWGVATVQSSDQPDADLMNGTANIRPLKFVYSCLAAGTRIRMADGSERAVEEVLAAHVIRAGDGSDRDVVSSVVGHHAGKVLRLRAGAAELVLSHNHVVMTPEGPKHASELAVGDAVNGEGGSLEVTAVDEEDFDGQLWNLSLSEPGEEPDPKHNSMYAGGIEVCDYEVQVEWERRRRRTKEAILAMLEPMYHQDYLNSLEETAATGG